MALQEQVVQYKGKTLWDWTSCTHYEQLGLICVQESSVCQQCPPVPFCNHIETPRKDTRN